MGHRKRTNKLLLVVATAGLTACEDDSHTNPPSPPLVCDDIAGGEELWATPEIPQEPPEGLDIELHTRNSWSGKPAVTAISGITIITVHDPAYFSGVVVNAALDVGATTAQFEVRGKVTDGATTCDVRRTFTVTVAEDQSVEITRNEELPLAPRRHATIEVLRRDGVEVELRAAGAAGERVAWTPTAGSVEEAPDGRARWRLPEEPGIYQVQMQIDRGDDGFTLDTLTLEVMG
ncbi:hypothetical protein WME89_11555 [Sorangium sp. So ce321]|uniref:hypothetical protein n=1 Tax=Sorangium sp. So ce321 TaxID=3133300 RepID=UPI003F602567